MHGLLLEVGSLGGSLLEVSSYVYQGLFSVQTTELKAYLVAEVNRMVMAAGDGHRYMYKSLLIT